MAQLYRQKLIEAEALQYTGSNQQEMMDFCPIASLTGGKLMLHGMEIFPNCWIQKGPAGNYIGCTPDFLVFYEPI